MNLNIAIVDDDIYFLNIIKNKLLSLNSHLSISCFKNPYDFLEKTNEFHYVLLDIELPEIDGITLSKQLRKNNISIFFITSHKEFMIKAFGKNVEGFILKENINQGIYDFLQLIKKHMEEECIKIHINDKKINICFLDILYIYYSLRDIEYHLINNQKIIQKNINLKDVAAQLNDDFVFINRNTLVNINYVNQMKNGCIYIRNKKFEISRRKLKNVKIKLFERRLNHDHF